MSYEKIAILAFCSSYFYVSSTPMFSCFSSYLFSVSVLQVVVCFTYVVLQAKCEENTEARASDIEGVINHDNCKRSFIAGGNNVSCYFASSSQ